MIINTKQLLGSWLLAALLVAGTACNNSNHGYAKDDAVETSVLDDATATPIASTDVGAELNDYSDGLQIGELAPDFELRGVDGKTHSLSSTMLEDGSMPKGYLVVFTCNTCPVSQQYEKRIIELHKKMAPKGYPLIAIQPNDPSIQPGDSFEAMQKRAQERNYPFVYLLDEGQKIYPQYGASRTPEIYVLDADRVLRYHGAIDDSIEADEASVNYVEQAIAALESGKDPDPAEVKAVGCSIKAKKS